MVDFSYSTFIRHLHEIVILANFPRNMFIRYYTTIRQTRVISISYQICYIFCSYSFVTSIQVFSFLREPCLQGLALAYSLHLLRVSGFWDIPLLSIFTICPIFPTLPFWAPTKLHMYAYVCICSICMHMYAYVGICRHTE